MTRVGSRRSNLDSLCSSSKKKKKKKKKLMQPVCLRSDRGDHDATLDAVGYFPLCKVVDSHLGILSYLHALNKSLISDLSSAPFERLLSTSQAILTLVVGMCLGWAWGAAAMASALRARSAILLASSYTRAQSQLVSGVAPDSQFQKFVFEGVFLDARSSAVFGAFFFVGMFALAGLKAVAPKLTFLSIFGMIVMVSSEGARCRYRLW
jgi:hypothetical protein